MNNFDWWTLVLVPLIVSIGAVYLQRVLDKVSKSSLSFVDKNRISKDVITVASTLARVVEDTYIGHVLNQQRLMLLSYIGSATAFIVVFGSIGGVHDASTSSAVYRLLIAAAGLGLFWVGSAFARQADKEHTVFRDPRKTVDLLIKRIYKLSPEQFKQEAEVIRRLANAIELERGRKAEAALGYARAQIERPLLTQPKEAQGSAPQE